MFCNRCDAYEYRYKQANIVLKMKALKQIIRKLTKLKFSGEYVCMIKKYFHENDDKCKYLNFI